MAFLSYGQQTLRYFDRPHDGPPPGPIGGPAAWRGADLSPDRWRHRLTPAELDDVECALRRRDVLDAPLEALTADAFPLPAWTDLLREIRHELAAGRGFVLLRGLPVSSWSEDHASRFFWSLGMHLGEPGAQNPQNDLLGHVRDTGEDRIDEQVRLYKTSADIEFHCDAADVVGLFCLQASASGGQSLLASSVTVYDEIRRRRPDLAARLFENRPLDLRNEDGGSGPGWIPVPPCRFAGGQLRTFYHSDYFRSAERHHDVHLPPEDRELLDLYDEIAHDPDVCLAMDLEPGDVQLVSNHTVVHARSGYEDDRRGGRARHLLRLWLSLP